ncbi:IS5/IS1182 family transposase, partial [Streptomyces sp. NPDC058232]
PPNRARLGGLCTGGRGRFRTADICFVSLAPNVGRSWLVNSHRAAPSLSVRDRGYDHEVYRDKVRRFQITPHLARRGTGHGSGLEVYRWGVEGAIALLHWFRRLRIR